MLFGDRPDGTRIPDLPPLRRIMPHVLATRAGASIYHEMVVDVSRTLPWLKETSARLGRELTLFQLVLYGAARTLHERPQLHRFVAGGRLWQRRHCDLSFAVKKRLEDSAGMTSVKVRFEAGDTLVGAADRVDKIISVGRGEKKTASEKEMSLVTLLPFFVISWLMGVQRFLDYWNLLPASMIDPDPLYASVFLANLGSVGLDAPWHHLYEYGTIPIFIVVGKIHKHAFITEDGRVEVRDAVVLRTTLDERVSDGLYCAKSLEILRGILEDPATHCEVGA